ncbi:hypothetical protein HDK77DRAFT_319447 [Phyllosticta capitalensis]|uniref:BTB domain-containing protein n=1 Tax=Phyllosticta capitalensis TaxID=121624 RepID=A0ABR1YJJ5_9PEZI
MSTLNPKKATLDGEKRIDIADGLNNFAKDGFKSQLYSDLTIRCKDGASGEDRDFFVHKMVLCLQSEFFANACKPNSPFVEAKTGVITLDEDAFIVELMLATIYSDEPHYLESRMRKYYSPLPTLESELHCIADIYAMGDKYRAPILMYNAGDTFGHRVRSRFSFEKPGCGTIRGFMLLAKKVFESTPDSARTFRNIIYLHTKSYIDTLMMTTYFQPEMDEVDGFWSGYARFLTFFTRRERRCPACGEACTKEWTDWRDNFSYGRMVMGCFNKVCLNKSSIEDWHRPVEEENNPGAAANGSGEEPNSHKRPRLS